MKRLILFALVPAMVLTLCACGCDHTAGDRKLVSVDTAALTAQWEIPCSQCGKVIETLETSTGAAPEDGVLPIAPADWFACLTTNVKSYDSSGALMPAQAESQDDALLYTVVSMGGLRSVISFFDKDGSPITTGQAAELGNVHRIRMDAQFENASTVEFYTLLLMIAMTNNGGWQTDAVNALCQQIMAGESVTDNGYSYTMEILSAEDHTVAVHIVAE